MTCCLKPQVAPVFKESASKYLNFFYLNQHSQDKNADMQVRSSRILKTWTFRIMIVFVLTVFLIQSGHKFKESEQIVGLENSSQSDLKTHYLQNLLHNAKFKRLKERTMKEQKLRSHKFVFFGKCRKCSLKITSFRSIAKHQF